MQIVSYELLQNTESNGTRYVVEKHIFDDGHSHLHQQQYSATVDAQAAMEARVAQINAEFQRREEILAVAVNYEIPLTKTDIMKRVTSEEWAAFQASTDPNVSYARDVFSQIVTPIYRGDAFTQAMFGILQAAGILTAERVAQVLSNG